jgi:hypothetical protein
MNPVAGIGDPHQAVGHHDAGRRCRMSAARDADNLSAENIDGMKNNGKIKIEALRGTYVGLKMDRGK